MAYTRLVPNYYIKQIFTSNQERELKDYFKECALKFYVVTTMVLTKWQLFMIVPFLTVGNERKLPARSGFDPLEVDTKTH